MSKVADAKPKLKRKEYEKHLRKLQTELCRLQDWVVEAGLRVLSCSKDATRPERGERSRQS